MLNAIREEIGQRICRVGENRLQFLAGAQGSSGRAESVPGPVMQTGHSRKNFCRVRQLRTTVWPRGFRSREIGWFLAPGDESPI